MSELTVFQIVGMGHSGSTLLSALVGANSRAFNVGEIDNISKLLLREAANACSCGAPVARCPFWTEVNATLARDGLAIHGFPGSPPHLKQADKAAILRAVGKASGEDAVVDSAKLPSRLAGMLQAEGLNIVPIFLYADPRKVIYSYMKKYGHSPLRRALKYNSLAFAMARLYFRMRRDGRRMGIISYEDLTRHPAAAVETLTDHIGLSFEPGQLAWTSGLGHSLAGNRMRFSDSDAIVHDASWRGKLTSKQKLVISLLSLPSFALLKAISRLDARRRTSPLPGYEGGLTQAT